MKKRIGVMAALKTLSKSKWSWRDVGCGLFIKRNNASAKCAALVAHDRILCHEILSRGMPSSIGERA